MPKTSMHQAAEKRLLAKPLTNTLTGLLTSLLLVLLLCTGCTAPSPPAAKKDIPVGITSPQVRDVTTYLETIGTLISSETYEIRPQVSGTLADILAKEGSWIEKGTPLFKIDDSHYAIHVQQAEAHLAMDEAARVAAKQKLERFRKLAEKNLIPKVEWEAIQAAAASAEAQILVGRAKLAEAELNLANCTLVSPGAGRLGKIDISIGALVSSSQAKPLGIVSQLQPLIVEFSLTEKEFAAFDPKTSVATLQSLCTPNTFVEANIFFLDHTFDFSSGKLLVRAELDNQALCLHPGQVVQVKLATNFLPQQILVPQKAIKYNSEGPYIYVVDENSSAAIRPVTLGTEIGDEVIVINGIATSDKVITVGHLRLFPGLKVEVKP